MSGPWSPHPYESATDGVPFERFVTRLTDFKVLAVDEAIGRVLAVRGLGLVRTNGSSPSPRAFTSSAFAMRQRRSLACSEVKLLPLLGLRSVLLRVFVHFHGDKKILLLGGYDKGQHPQPRRQEREIARNRKYLREFRSNARQ